MMPVNNTLSSSAYACHLPVETDNWRQLLHTWEAWARQTPLGTDECRDIAVRRLDYCLLHHPYRLDLSGLALTALPKQFPADLQHLDLSDNNLTGLPDNLPASLTELNVKHNQLTNLPDRLPVSLIYLDVIGNQLISLPERLPSSLNTLHGDHNRLIRLPESLPDSLKILYVNNNQLTDLPAHLPFSLVELHVNCNRFTHLPDTIIASLKELNAECNQLIRLPERLPDALIMLNVNNNQLTALPAHLPASLVNLFVSGNRLRDLPESLPDSLNTLNCNNNQLVSLPMRLPMSLMSLCLSNNWLTVLPESLPDALKVLNVNYNRLTSLPVRLPTSLMHLYVSSNQLTHLPESLPDSLKTLNVDYNQLTHLPTFLPFSLVHFYVRYNRLTRLPVTLPLSLITLDVGNNPLDSGDQTPANFLAKLTCWHEGIDSGRWQNIYTESHVGDFVTFLDKLHQGNNRSSAALRGQVGRWLDYLAQDGHGELREKTFVLANEAMVSCVDRASYYFTLMQILQTEHQLLRCDVSPEEVVKAILVNFRLQTLHDIAMRHVAARRALSPDFAEDLEIYLAYQYELRAPLALPVYSEMQFSEIAGLTDEDIRQAKETVAEAEKADFMHYWLTKSALWEAILTKWDGAKKAAADDQYVEDINEDNCKFKAEVDKRLRDLGIAVNDADARQAVSDQLAKELLYAQRYQLSREYLAEKQALSLLEQCNSATL